MATNDHEPGEIPEKSSTSSHTPGPHEFKGDDVFRFMAISRPGEVDSDRTIDFESERSPLRERLAGVRGYDEAVMIIEREFKHSNDFVRELDSLNLPVAEFVESVYSEDVQTLSTATLESVAESTFDGSPAEVVTSTAYETDRARLEDSYAALVLSPGRVARTGLDKQLGDGIRVLESLRVLANPEDERSISDVLTAFIVTPREILDVDVEVEDDGGDWSETQLVPEELMREFSDVRTSLEEVTHRAFVDVDFEEIDFRHDLEPSERSDPVTESRSGVLGGLMQAVRASNGSTSLSEDVVEGSPHTGVSMSTIANDLSNDTLSTVQKISPKDSLENADIHRTIGELQRNEARLGASIMERVLGPGKRELVQIGDSFVPVSDSNGSVAVSADLEGLAEIDSDVSQLSSTSLNSTVDVLGVTDLEVVRQQLEAYELGELSNVENVLQGETRERTHRRLERFEEETETELKSIEEREDYHEKTDRYELQREISETVREDTNVAMGAEVSASYGPSVEVDAYVDYSTSTTTEETEHTARGYAQEVVTRTVNRMKEEIHEREFQRVIEETEETNSHGVDNVDGDGHVAGLYRWIDKIYREQVYNYGSRLMLEFLVPEPAAFYRRARAQNPAENVRVEKPEPPRYAPGLEGLFQNPYSDIDSVDDLANARELRPSDLNRANYWYYVQQYGATNVSPPPDEYAVRGESFNKELDGEYSRYTVDEGEIEIPDGYNPVEAYYVFTFNVFGSQWDHFRIDMIVGATRVRVKSDTITNYGGIIDIPYQEQDTDSLPVTITRWRSAGYGCNVIVRCERTEDAFEEWQLETYDEIMSAYNTMQSDYEEAVAAAEIQAGMDETGGSQNPQRNEEIVGSELKKSAIKLLRQQYFTVNAVTEVGDTPAPDFSATAIHRDTIQFFEHALEWQQMSYVFYPYYWTDREKWATLLELDDASDPRFAQFLRAGAARVLIPVRPGYNFDVLYFLQSNQLYGGDGRPEIGDPRYVPIAEEIKERSGQFEDEESVGDPWFVRIPTSLVKLQQSQKLEDVEIGTAFDASE